MKCGVLYFTKKVASRKNLRFPENSKFFEIHNFRQNSPKLVTPRRKFPGIWPPHKTQKCKNIWVSPNSRDKIQNFPGKFLSKFLIFMKIRGRPFHEFPGILVVRTPKNVRIYGFPGILELKSRFFPGNFYENLEFSRHFGVTRHEIPGNFGRWNPGKCRNIWVSGLFGGKIRSFPGNFGRPVDTSRKSDLIPQACTFKNIRVSRSPQAPILGPKKDPQKFICT